MKNLQDNQTKVEYQIVKEKLPNPVTPTLDFAHESKEQFIDFLIEIEVDKYLPWCIKWINTYWTDDLIAAYMKNGYDGLLDYDIIEHMSEWRKAEEGKQVSIVH